MKTSKDSQPKEDKLMKLWNDVEISKRILTQLDETVQDYDNQKLQHKQAIHTTWTLKTLNKNQSNANFTNQASSSSSPSVPFSFPTLATQSKCRKTLPAELWANQNELNIKKSNRADTSTSTEVPHLRSSNSSSIIFDEFNILKGIEVTDREMPRGKRIKPILN